MRTNSLLGVQTVPAAETVVVKNTTASARCRGETEDLDQVGWLRKRIRTRRSDSNGLMSDEWFSAMRSESDFPRRYRLRRLAAFLVRLRPPGLDGV
jgi:hypothetical protein